MTHVVVVGGGPAGLSAALFTAKNGLETTVYDTDETWMHKAHLFNYPGIESKDGTEYVEATRDQVEGFGATIETDSEVASVAEAGDGFTVETADGDETAADYVVLATGADRSLAEDLGCTVDDDGTIAVDLDTETSVEDVYATGAMVRAEEWQAVIAAGDGAAAALHILSKEKGEHFHDFDTPADAE
jgi:thioredoxin reductase